MVVFFLFKINEKDNQSDPFRPKKLRDKILPTLWEKRYSWDRVVPDVPELVLNESLASLWLPD